MKIKQTAEKFNFEEEKFWNEVGNYLRYGLPAHDKRGHCSEIRFRVRPFQLDIIGGIREKMPEGWYKNRTFLVRGLLAVGCKCALEYLKRNKDSDKKEIEKIDGWLKDMNRISTYTRLDDFKKDLIELEKSILKGHREDKAELINLIDMIREKVKKEQCSI